jgi:hypothetical protein
MNRLFQSIGFLIRMCVWGELYGIASDALRERHLAALISAITVRVVHSNSSVLQQRWNKPQRVTRLVGVVCRITDYRMTRLEWNSTYTYVVVVFGIIKAAIDDCQPRSTARSYGTKDNKTSSSSSLSGCTHLKKKRTRQVRKALVSSRGYLSSSCFPSTPLLLCFHFSTIAPLCWGRVVLARIRFFFACLTRV